MEAELVQHFDVRFTLDEMEIWYNLVDKILNNRQSIGFNKNSFTKEELELMSDLIETFKKD